MLKLSVLPALVRAVGCLVLGALMLSLAEPTPVAGSTENPDLQPVVATGSASVEPGGHLPFGRWLDHAQAFAHAPVAPLSLVGRLARGRDMAAWAVTWFATLPEPRETNFTSVGHAATGTIQVGGAMLWKIYAEVMVESECAGCDCVFVEEPQVSIQPSMLISLLGGEPEMTCRVLYTAPLAPEKCRTPDGCPGGDGGTAQTMNVYLECTTAGKKPTYPVVTVSSCPSHVD